MNFSRVQWRLDTIDGVYRKAVDPETGKPLAEDNWVWSPQREIAMHEPEYWGIVEFRRSPSEAPVEPTGDDAAAWHLRYATYLLAAQHTRKQSYPAEFIAPAPPAGAPPLDPAWLWPPVYEVHGQRYSLTLSRNDGPGTLIIYEDGRLVRSH